MLSMMAEQKKLVLAGVRTLTGAGAPTNGAAGTGAGDAGPGSMYIDTTNMYRYMNIGTQAVPLWRNLSVADMQSLRTRASIAQINAGLELLSAIPGFAYRVVDMKAISVGGNVGGATGVDIKATKATVVSKLLAIAIAALTRSTVVRAGATNAVVLADGASFTVNDANTGITVIKDGADLTTATHVDIFIDYVMEKA